MWSLFFVFCFSFSYFFIQTKSYSANFEVLISVFFLRFLFLGQSRAFPLFYYSWITFFWCETSEFPMNSLADKSKMKRRALCEANLDKKMPNWITEEKVEFWHDCHLKKKSVIENQKKCWVTEKMKIQRIMPQILYIYIYFFGVYGLFSKKKWQSRNLDFNFGRVWILCSSWPESEWFWRFRMRTLPFVSPSTVVMDTVNRRRFR